LQLLHNKGADIAYSDSHVLRSPKMREYHWDLASVELSASSVSAYDCPVLTTDHDRLGYELLMPEATLVVDARERLPGASNVVPD